MKKAVLALACTLLGISCQHEDINAMVYRADEGYGYKIVRDGKVLINQGTIPSVPGGRKFCDSIDAVKVSDEVIKLLRSQKSPAITADEIRRLNIKLRC